MKALVQVASNGAAHGRTPEARPDSLTPWCNQALKPGSAWQVDWTAEPDCQRCAKARKAVTPMFEVLR